MKYKSFETERLILQPTSTKDSEFIFQLFNSPKWLKYIGDRNIKSVENAKQYINDNMMPQLQKLGYSSYTIIRKKDQQKIGTCGLYNRNGLDGIDIGFAFLPEYENKGFAFEAANRLKNAAFTEFDIERILAITKKGNSGSHKLLKKLGLELSGTITLPNDNTELLLYTIEK
ncbi:GNAT family N-acetyltransferase [Aurantibacter sp.]|uniref:GNAT family N-acetyltransferase n=1 Tax=Aurantibacter sp. TaxID=2807103 RepID=UPI0032676E6E